jgi:hypothetical protein
MKPATHIPAGMIQMSDRGKSTGNPDSTFRQIMKENKKMAGILFKQ